MLDEPMARSLDKKIPTYIIEIELSLRLEE
jgi:hypothetical protein